ncbi:MAG: hypothetical protein GY739_01430 [Mesoflavibacter sp.]|nr:hypothetical protein [Mesoflavibacter sp.]
MKKIIFILCALISITAFSQTSMEEYNYLTKGYLLDKQTGRDLKSGYRMDATIPPFSQNINDGKNTITRKLRILKFVRTEDEKVVALLVIENREDTGYEGYICVPSILSSSEVKNLASKDFFSRAENKSSETVSAYHYYWLSLQILGKAYID